jgi:hypothetical protein
MATEATPAPVDETPQPEAPKPQKQTVDPYNACFRMHHSYTETEF